jgi:UDP:flavonoid glycosyltransferase YjiC (YdhE family)
MTNFLFTTLPTNDLGLLTRSLPIARELAARGHRIAFCSPAPAPGRLVAEAGFENVRARHPLYELMATRPDVWGLFAYLRSGSWRDRHESLFRVLREIAVALPVRRAPPTDEVWNMDHAGAIMGMLNQGFVRAGAEALRGVITASTAEVVVDFWNPFAVIAARAEGRPLVTVIQADAHPGNRGFIWWKQPPSQIPTTVPIVNAVLAEYGLPPIEKLGELSVGDLTLVVGTPETDPLPEDAEATHVGPLVWEREGERLPSWIDALGSDRPLIWVYSGNPRYGSAGDSLDSAVVLEACIAALAGQRVHVAVTTGHHRLPEEFLPLPPNFRHEPYLPGLAMAARSDLLIHHGGYGSCQTGFLAGKPAVIVPTYSERESNARRVAALGAGLVVPVARVSGRKHVDVLQLRSAVGRVLAERAFAENARAVGDKLLAYGGAALAADLVEEFAQRTVRRA